MSRPKKKSLKKLVFDNYYVNLDIYKRTVVTFQLRFDYYKENDNIIDISSLKDEVSNLFESEFGIVKKSKNIFETDLPDTMQQHTGRCSLNCYFMRNVVDDYEDFVLRHCEYLMKDIEELFNKNNIEIVKPKRTNNYTKTY